MVSASGDPHLVNQYGQRFDLGQAGVHVLLHIPKGARPKATYFHVAADAQRLGNTCADLYFQNINITGKWVNMRGGLQFSVNAKTRAKWMHFGRIQLKVVHGHTNDEKKYLNIFVKGIGKERLPVGGLLGGDDHTLAAKVSEDCKRATWL